MQDMPKTIAHSKIEERPSINTPENKRKQSAYGPSDRGTDTPTASNKSKHHTQGGAEYKILVPFRSAKYQFTGVISILRNGTEQKKKDGISSKDVDLLYNS